MFKSVCIFIIFFIFVFPGTGSAIVDNAYNLIVNEGEVYGLRGFHRYLDSVIINGTIELPDTVYPLILGTITLKAPRIYIGPTGKIDADGAGWHKGPGTPPDFIPTYSVDLTPSAGYGGDGANGLALDWIPFTWTIPAGGLAYGDPHMPNVQMGSSGADDGFDENPLRGGGAIKLIASEEVVVRGVLTADGDIPETYWDCWYGGGSGGGILIAAPRVILMGLVSAKGTIHYQGFPSSLCLGTQAPDGGGGRIKIFFEDMYKNIFATLDVSTNEDWSGGVWLDGSFWETGILPKSGTISIIDLKDYPFRFKF